MACGVARSSRHEAGRLEAPHHAEVDAKSVLDHNAMASTMPLNLLSSSAAHLRAPNLKRNVDGSQKAYRII
jgi:hypothetical protein